ncbi:MAG: aminopeptidase P family protein [Chloroflexi bacterium]|nr:aminopeptidase P family protein [Chloroflexota bacterium]
MMTISAARLAVLRDAAARAGFQGLVINQPAYIFYLSGWLPPADVAAFVVIGPRDTLLVAPFAPGEAVAPWRQTYVYETFRRDRLVSALDNGVAALLQAVADAGLRRLPVGVALAALPAAYALPLAQVAQLHDARDMLFRATMVKDAVAQQAIRARVAILDRAFAVAARTIRPGVSEMQVFTAIYAEIALAIGAQPALACVFGSGPRTLLDEPQPSDRVLEPGDVVLIDLFPTLRGYVADYTRCFVVGPATDAQRAQHMALERALAAVEQVLRPGVSAADIDRIARHSIEEAGYGPWCYQHHTGHGFGLLAPEPPWLIPADTTRLEAGMVLAVEPGIYHPVHGGMRLEGNYLITANGCESLTGYPATLTECV